MGNREEKKRGLWKALKDEVVTFFSESTIPGFKYVVQGRNRFERATWAVFIAAAFSVAIYGMKDAFEDWEKHPVETTIDEVGLPVHELPFPAITVCDTTSLTMPRKNRWKFVEKLLNSLELVDPEEELKRIYPGKCLQILLYFSVHRPI